MHIETGLDAEELLCLIDSRGNAVSVLSACLCHIRTTAAATAYDRCDTFNKISSVRSCFLSCICSHSKKVYFTSVYSCKNNNTFSDLFFELISKITKSVHINALNLGCKEFYAFNINDLVHNITERSLSQFALERFILALERFYFCLKMCDLLSNFCRLCFECFGNFLKHSLLFFIVFNNAVSCQRLNTTHPCCNTCLRYDFEEHDGTCVFNMCTTTEFF
mgnify:CR=1 FL=1